MRKYTLVLPAACPLCLNVLNPNRGPKLTSVTWDPHVSQPLPYGCGSAGYRYFSVATYTPSQSGAGIFSR